MVLAKTSSVLEDISVAEFRHGVQRAGLVGDSYAPTTQWAAIRQTAVALFNSNAALKQVFHDTGMRLKGIGYVFRFSKWPFFVLLPSGTQLSRSHGTVQLLMTRPRTHEETNFVYQLMEACRLVLQISDATGGRTVYPRSVTVDDVLAGKLATGSTKISRTVITADAVHMKDGVDLFRFLRTVKGGS